ncbi:DUF3892 domain-containing protein [candidate division WOR-3 bacterium]|uniref:DUF3892 domain-containing protein n=1 Tax=candidate division WOR-3 bacterium TaxID=2052148 RepID=A0A9D5K8E7_UNCW3|nr:DUF3892 domain-containing protein [candidate division WOR-3 bacterium]MBD3364353.1 DUF3892 domain-containing protein [candidate division WOR-3 bacterium]
MAKWADYLISAVRYDENHERIVKVRYCLHQEDGIRATEYEISRSTVVSRIENGYTFITVFLDKDEKVWRKGSEVHIITVDGEKFIRTDTNAKKADNLENLPEF